MTDNFDPVEEARAELLAEDSRRREEAGLGPLLTWDALQRPPTTPDEAAGTVEEWIADEVIRETLEETRDGPTRPVIVTLPLPGETRTQEGIPRFVIPPPSHP